MNNDYEEQLQRCGCSFLCSEFFVMSNFVETLYTNEMLEFQHFKGVLCYNYFRHVIG